MKRRYQWALVSILTLISVLSRLKFNGLVLNFDYGIYQPDGSHYAYRTLTFLGVDSNVAAERVVHWYQIHGFKNNLFSAELLSPQNLETWGLVAPRIIYSVLSMPFVYLLGISGMMVIPVFSFLILIFAVYRLSEIQNNRLAGMVVVLALTTAPTVLRWMIANITDSLLTALFAILVLVLAQQTTRRTWFNWVVALILLSSFTRFCLPIWVSIAFVYWINRKRTESLTILITSLLAFIPTFIFMPKNALLPAETQSSGVSKILLLVESFFKVGFVEIAELAALDRILLSVLIIAIIISFKFTSDLSCQLFLSVLIAVFFIGAINGTLGVNFRYQLPVLPFACWAIFSNLVHFSNWIRWGRIDVISEKTEY